MTYLQDHRIIFHVGYPKCGSTSLQQNLFPLGSALKHIRTKGQYLEEMRLVGSSKASRELLRELKDDFDCRKINILSNEDMLHGGVGFARTLESIADHAPKSELLLIIRSQHEIIRSLYDMKPGGIKAGENSYIRPLKVPEFYGSLRTERTFLESLKFGQVISEAYKYFEPENVHVFSFEGLFRSRREVDKFARVFGMSESDMLKLLSRPPKNESEMHKARRRMRSLLGPIRGSWFLPRTSLVAINHLIGRYISWPLTELPKDIAKEISDYYQDDSKILSQLVPEICPL